MRKEYNPNKDIKLSPNKYIHRIIIPLCINDSEYSKDLLKIFQISLESLLKTIHSRTSITVINNGSNIKTVDYLNENFKNGTIQELIHTGPIGKVNALLKVIRSLDEDIITITDSDVFFLNNWQDETIKVFNSFNKAGVVGIVPQFKMYNYLSYNLFFDNFFSKKLKFDKVVNPQALKKFYKSIGWKDDYNEQYLKTNLILKSSNDLSALVGSGHFVATYRNEVFKKLPKKKSEFLLGGGSVKKYLDLPVIKYGGWRLTTRDNYAYHMGNIYEDWMKEELNILIDESKRKIVKSKNIVLRTSKFSYYFKNHIFRKLISNKKIFKKILTQKGLQI